MKIRHMLLGSTYKAPLSICLLPLTNLAPGVYQLAVSNNRKGITRQFVYAQ